MIDKKIKNGSQAVTLCLGALWTLISASPAGAQPATLPQLVDVKIEWKKSVGESKTNLTVQVCPEPPMRRGGPIHEQAHAALRDLKMSYARLQPWFPYPKLAIAELDPPTAQHTSWDFSRLDPIVLDFYAAAEGRPIVLNFDLPGWLFKGKPPSYPDDPNEIDWRYQWDEHVSKQLRDPTYREVAGYYRRMAEWYIRGGFMDELGKAHRSGHHLKIDYWEILNEQNGIGHDLSPRVQAELYDAVVSELRQVDPKMKFSALGLVETGDNRPYIEYFLNPKNHRLGIPLDMVSYHMYVTAQTGHTPEQWQREMFEAADKYLVTARDIERIRRRLSPSTKTAINEFGFQWGPEADKLAAAFKSGRSDTSEPNIPAEYWNLSASVFAYTYVGVARAGADLLGSAELVDYPSQLAGLNLIHWKTGEPNAVYRVVRLLHEQFPPGGTLLQTDAVGDGLEAQAFDTSSGRKLLLINKTREPRPAHVSGAAGTVALTVDSATGSRVPRRDVIKSDTLLLQPQAVTVITWEKSLR